MKALKRIIVSVVTLLSGCNLDLWFWESASSISVVENTTGVFYTASARHSDYGAAQSYALAGEDAAHFVIDSSSGELSFAATLDYEQPNDANGDNTYQISISALAGEEHSEAFGVTIRIVDMREVAAPAVFPWPGSYLDNHVGEYIPFIFAAVGITEDRRVYGPSGQSSGFDRYVDPWCVGIYSRSCYDDDVGLNSNTKDQALFDALFDHERVLPKASESDLIRLPEDNTWGFAIGFAKASFSGDFVIGEFDHLTANPTIVDKPVKVAEFEFRPRLKPVQELSELTIGEHRLPKELRVIGDKLLFWSDRHLWLSDVTLRHVERLLSLDVGQVFESVTMSEEGEVLFLYGVSSAEANGEIVHQVAKYSEGRELELLGSEFAIPGLQDFLLPREVVLSFASSGSAQEFYLGGVLAEECLDNIVPGEEARAFVYEDGGIEVFDLYLQVEEPPAQPSMMGCIRNDHQTGMIVDEGVLAQLAAPPVYFIRKTAERGAALELTMSALRLSVAEGAGSTFSDFQFSLALDVSGNVIVNFDVNNMSSVETYAPVNKFPPSTRFPARPVELDEFFYSKSYYEKLFVVDGRISYSLEEPLTGENYRVNSFDFHGNSHVIYSLGRYGDLGVPVISGHHLPSNTSAYLPLSEVFGDP